MDDDNLKLINYYAPENHRADIRLFLSFAKTPETAVPDPYYGGQKGFENVFSLVDQGCEALIKHLSHKG